MTRREQVVSLLNMCPGLTRNQIEKTLNSSKLSTFLVRLEDAGEIVRGRKVHDPITGYSMATWWPPGEHREQLTNEELQERLARVRKARRWQKRVTA